MKVRVKFAKLGFMKFIGHLDIMRYFQKAIRRADIDISYSEGFNPHQKMSFAAPLGVGIESIGEYMDIEVDSAMHTDALLALLNEQMVPGMEVLSVKYLEDDAKNSMSIVAAADYEVTIRKEYNSDIDLNKILSFYQLEEINCLKKSKKSEKVVDIKPMIYQLSLQEETIFMKLATGSVLNLKPDLVMEAFFAYLEKEMPEFALKIKRLELYADIGEETNHNFVALDSFGKELE